MTKGIFLFLIAAGYYPLSFAQHAQPAISFSSVVTAFARQQHFNGTILVEQHGKKIYYQSFGMANFQFEVPNTNDTKYKIASITKLFTSVLVMQLVEQGKIALNQSIKAYLPNYRGEGKDSVKIWNLLTATSGIESNEKGANDIDVTAMYNRPYTTDQLLVFCARL